MKFDGQTLSFFYLLVGIPEAFSNKSGLIAKTYHGNDYEPLPAGESIELSDSRSHGNESRQHNFNADDAVYKGKDYEPLPAGETIDLSDSRSHDRKHSNESRQQDALMEDDMAEDAVSKGISERPLPAGETIKLLESRSHISKHINRSYKVRDLFFTLCS
mmetsp:Transcript_20371/g.23245  ORF Transcript_20371/g.23245 Transcript_20371/m.23245 type:complete len:160 (+) Transcript_20371:77-556(+)